jgi:hypothetical protein
MAATFSLRFLHFYARLSISSPFEAFSRLSANMAPYDSDSSGGEDNDYTETNVLLGYASKEASDDTISYLGGTPVSPRHSWLYINEPTFESAKHSSN